MIVFVDTSAFCALLDRDDIHHGAAAAIWAKVITNKTVLLTSNYVVVETCALLQRKLGIEAVRAFHESMLPLVDVEWISTSHHDAAMASVLTANRRELSLVDCSSFVLMRSMGLRTAFAFDEHFTEQGFGLPLQLHD